MNIKIILLIVLIFSYITITFFGIINPFDTQNILCSDKHILYFGCFISGLSLFIGCLLISIISFLCTLIIFDAILQMIILE